MLKRCLHTNTFIYNITYIYIYTLYVVTMYVVTYQCLLWRGTIDFERLPLFAELEPIMLFVWIIVRISMTSGQQFWNLCCHCAVWVCRSSDALSNIRSGCRRHVHRGVYVLRTLLQRLLVKTVIDQLLLIAGFLGTDSPRQLYSFADK